MDLLTDFFLCCLIALQGRGGSEATDQPLVGGSKLALSRAVLENAMAFVPVPECWRVALRFDSLGGKPAANVFHVHDTLGVMSSARAEELANVIDNWGTTTWSPQASNQWTLRTIAVADASDNEGASFELTTPTAGALTSSPLPSDDTVAISFRTGAMGRSNRGRLYHVGLVEDSIQDGVLAPSPMTALINVYETLRSDLLADDFELVVASFQENGVLKNPATFRAVNQVIIVDNLIDSQKGRK